MRPSTMLIPVCVRLLCAVVQRDLAVVDTPHTVLFTPLTILTKDSVPSGVDTLPIDKDNSVEVGQCLAQLNELIQTIKHLTCAFFWDA